MCVCVYACACVCARVLFRVIRDILHNLRNKCDVLGFAVLTAAK